MPNQSLDTADIVIVGSGMGGASMAWALAPTRAKIVILEKGYQLQDSPETRDPRAIFQRGHFRPKENWYSPDGTAFNPGNYYYHGGNTKFYGAVLLRYRAEDFDGLAHADGDTPPWPFRYDELAPYYDAAERLYQVRGILGEDPTEPVHQQPYPYPPLPDEAPVADVRARLKRIGLNPSSLPMGLDLERWLARAPTTWDTFPDARSGKMDAETCALLPALEHSNVTIVSGADVSRLIAAADGKHIDSVEYKKDGEVRRIRCGTVVLAAGAVRSAAILLASGSHGLANRSDMVGRNFMNHNLTALIGFDPRFRNDSVYQKTFALHDFYLSDGTVGGPPLGTIQLFGRISGAILKSRMKYAPEALLEWISRHSIDFFAMSEDLPSPDSRVRLDGNRIVLDWQRTNMTGHRQLVSRFRAILKEIGFPMVFTQLFDRRTPSHQCGTIRLGDDPATAPLDPFGRAFDHPNLFVTDASTLVTSAAVNPSLTVAALSLRASDEIRRSFLGMSAMAPVGAAAT